jgi:hypothetical protein
MSGTDAPLVDDVTAGHFDLTKACIARVYDAALGLRLSPGVDDTPDVMSG